jgi:hypothetical protein
VLPTPTAVLKAATRAKVLSFQLEDEFRTMGALVMASAPLSFSMAWCVNQRSGAGPVIAGDSKLNRVCGKTEDATAPVEIVSA